MNTATTAKVCIVGAGLAGLTAARELARSGREVLVIDKGRGVGGRMATRRIGDAVLDHGAQFFTVRGDDFRATVDEAIAQSVVDVWCHGFGTEDGYPRYYCPRGMTALAKWLTEQITEAGGQIRLAERVSAIEPAEQGWRLPLESGEACNAQQLLVTSPVPQTLELLDAGNTVLQPTIRAELDAITYKPTIALLVSLDSKPAIPPPGGVQQTEDDVFTFIADDQQKGISPDPAATFHLNGSISSARWDDDPDTLVVDLINEARPWLGDADIVTAQLQKWKYAGPRNPHPDRCVVAATTPGTLVLAGDAFGGPKVEGAFNSGLAAAQALRELGEPST